MSRTLLMVLLMVSGLLGGDIIIRPSEHSVDETIVRMQHIITAKGLDVFAVIDHQQNATGVDMEMAPSKVIIFGDPKMGTVLMQKQPIAGLDLPLRVLVYEDDTGAVKIAYRDGIWLQAEHAVEHPELIAKLDGALDKMTTKAGRD